MKVFGKDDKLLNYDILGHAQVFSAIAQITESEGQLRTFR